ncbi:MAG TPA: urate oxidase [Verrucomicrobiaceae bacterium]|jgi:urate oxidase
MKLVSQNYGKSRVRVMKVLRQGGTHTIKELSVRVALEGEFETSYTEADNSKVVPTDTVKNTVNVLAHDHLGADNEPFALVLAQHFLNRYSQIARVRVELRERLWSRMSIGSQPHPHSFIQSDGATPFVQLVFDQVERRLESGITNFVILKSTASGFENYPRCEFTTLPETSDRIFATAVTATWRWSNKPPDYGAANHSIIRAIVKPFAENYSPSVQATMWEMGQAALNACSTISQITLALPNLHCLLINLKPFDRENPNVTFVPTDEPHGQIEATIARE